MNTRVFIKKIVLLNIAVLFTALFSACEQSKYPEKPENNFTCDTDTCKGIIRFGICADTHQDYVYQVPPKMQEFINEMNKEKVNFIIQLGDFCFPKEENNVFLSIWKSFNGPKYHVIGNHDCEISSKQVFMDYVDYPSDKSYYSFDYKGYHFVILDLNFGLKNGEILPYTANYGKISANDFESVTYINDAQYDWLERDLKSTNKRTVIFSHQPINSGLSNRDRFDKIIAKENSAYKKVVVAFSGHNHQDWLTEEKTVYHWQINSMCYKYCGSNCLNDTRYPHEVYAAYPVMKKMFPYKEPLYSIIEIDPANRTIKTLGKNSTFIPPTPTEMGFYGISSNISARTIKY